VIPSYAQQKGSAFYVTPFAFSDKVSFMASFSFKITSGTFPPADGLAFILSTSTSLLGDSGNYVGFASSSVNNENPSPISSFAVKFDSNSAFFNYVSLLKNSDPTEYAESIEKNLIYNSGYEVNVWIDYDDTMLAVYTSYKLTKPATPILLTTFDLSYLAGKSVYFGFSAGSGDSYGAHEVTNTKPLTFSNYKNPACHQVACDTLLEGNAEWPITSFGANATGTCNSGYSGSVYRQCLRDIETNTPYWGPIYGSCIEGKSAIINSKG
jgi:hypothetical protein